jgi:hypothetical protein
VPADTKLSKLDTLRLASSYIAHLRRVLDCDEEPDAFPPPPSNAAAQPHGAGAAAAGVDSGHEQDKACIHPLALVGQRPLHQNSYQSM